MDSINPSYRFTHRPEGWQIAFQLGDYNVMIGYYQTEAEAIRELNSKLAHDGFIKYRLDGGCLPKD